MDGETRLQQIMRAYATDPEITRRAEELADEVGPELHMLAHEYLVAMTSLVAPCEPLTDLFVGFLKIGFAHALLSARAPAEEQGSSGPTMSDDELGRLLGDVKL